MRDLWMALAITGTLAGVGWAQQGGCSVEYRDSRGEKCYDGGPMVKTLVDGTSDDFKKIRLADVDTRTLQYAHVELAIRGFTGMPGSLTIDELHNRFGLIEQALRDRGAY